MFGWFQPTCPVELQDKVWVELRLAWLFERFGARRILDAPRILPTREFFPDPYDGTSDSVTALFKQVCVYMGTDVQRFDLSLFSEKQRQDALGLYQQADGCRPRVWLLDSLLPNQEAVIATLAHEIAHDLLLGSGLVMGNEPDHEQLTDLLPIAFGMGTFHANTVIKLDSGIEGNMSYWSVRKSGYLGSGICGYGMAVIEWLRGSAAVPSIAYLGVGAASAMRSGHRYLLKTNDCLIDPSCPERPPAAVLDEQFKDIAKGSASRCLSALQQWLTADEISTPQVDAVIRSLQREAPAIQSTAITILSKGPAPSVEAIDAIVSQLYSADDSVRQKATEAIGRFQQPLTRVTDHGQTIFDVLLWLTKGPHSATAVAAATVLGTHGQAAAAAAPQILSLLVNALLREPEAIEPLLDSLSKIVGDLRAFLNDHPHLLPEGQIEMVLHELKPQRVSCQFPRLPRFQRRP